MNSAAGALTDVETELTAIQDEVSDGNTSIETGIESISSLEKNRRLLQSRLAASETEATRLSTQLKAAYDK